MFMTDFLIAIILPGRVKAKTKKHSWIAVPDHVFSITNGKIVSRSLLNESATTSRTGGFRMASGRDRGYLSLWPLIKVIDPWLDLLYLTLFFYVRILKT
jgi:hypothetical protein